VFTRSLSEVLGVQSPQSPSLRRMEPKKFTYCFYILVDGR